MLLSIKKILITVSVLNTISTLPIPAIDEITFLGNTEYVEIVPEYLIDVTGDEVDLLARVVMSEASTLEYNAKVAVAQTIVNRVRSDYREFKKLTTITDVVYSPNQFSTQDNGDPNEDCYAAAIQALTTETYLTDMLWFRKGYVKYGNEYKVFGEGKRTTYFSTLSERGQDE